MNNFKTKLKFTTNTIDTKYFGFRNFSCTFEKQEIVSKILTNQLIVPQGGHEVASVQQVAFAVPP